MLLSQFIPLTPLSPLVTISLFSIVTCFKVCKKVSLPDFFQGYFWALYSVSFKLCFIALPVPYCHDYCSYIERRHTTERLFFKITLAFQGLLCFHTNYKNFCSNAVMNATGNLIGISLNL